MQSALIPIDTPIPEPVRGRFGPYFESPRSARGFHNPWPHPKMPSLRDVFRWKLQPNTARAAGYRPRSLDLPTDALAEFDTLRDAKTRLLWLGHASFLFEMDEVRFVIDPIFGRAGGVTPRVTNTAVAPDKLQNVQLVLLTHGHHDHLDPRSLKALVRGNGDQLLFVVPEGMRSTMPRECSNVVELSWWQHVRVGPLKVHFVPAQHWHQRTPFDRNQRLWGGYVVEGTHRIFHSGDTGYFGGFEAVGAVFGGVDAACLPLGAYEPTWFMGTQHMNPEQSLAAYRALRATHFVGMHWGAFDLSNEAVDDGARWLLEEVRNKGLPPAHFQLLAPGGSLGLYGPEGSTQATPRHVYRPSA